MIGFYGLSNFENIGSVIELHQSSQAGRNTKHQKQNSNGFYSTSI